MKWTSVIIPFERLPSPCRSSTDAWHKPKLSERKNVAICKGIFTWHLNKARTHHPKMTSIPHWIQSSMSNGFGLRSILSVHNVAHSRERKNHFKFWHLQLKFKTFWVLNANSMTWFPFSNDVNLLWENTLAYTHRKCDIAGAPTNVRIKFCFFLTFHKWWLD